MRTEPLIAIIAAAALSAACTKSEINNTYTSQSEKIEKYVSTLLDSNPDMRVVYNESVLRLVTAEGSGTELEQGGTASILYAGYNFNTTSMSKSTLFATNDSDVAASNGWTLTDESIFDAVDVCLSDDDIVKGLRMGLEGAREGEECLILFSGKYGFGKQVGTIPANAALAYSVKIQKVTN